MRLFAALFCLLASCLAQKPQPCTSPPLLSGTFSLSTQDERLESLIHYLYDEVGQRIRFMAQGKFENKTFQGDYLLHYKEGVLYDIVDSNSTCMKYPLKEEFQPLGIPKTASLLAQVVLGGSSEPGQGLTVNVWVGEQPKKAGGFMSTVTELGCIPVSGYYQTKQFGWVIFRYFNNIVGVSDPSRFNTPNFCPQEEAEPENERKDFLSLFIKNK